MRCHLPTLDRVLTLFCFGLCFGTLLQQGAAAGSFPLAIWLGAQCTLAAWAASSCPISWARRGWAADTSHRSPATWHVTRDTTIPWPWPRGTWVRVQVVEEGRVVAGELGGVAAPRVRVLVVRERAATCPHVCLILTTPDQSCKRRFPKIALIFQNHGKCPYWAFSCWLKVLSHLWHY